MDQETQTVVLKRIFVGGLFSNITKEELSNRFRSFGKVSEVDIIQRKNEEGDIQKTFAYVNISGTEPKIKKCMALYDKTKWKGNELRLQFAKEDPLTRLAKERAETQESSDREPISNSLKNDKPCPTKSYDVIASKVANMKGAVPGVLVAGEKGWVVGKYGRALPILYLRKKGKIKLTKVDPSKLCHNLKRLKDTSLDELNVPVDTLTWDIPEKINPLKKNEYVERLESITSDGDCNVDSEFTENKLSPRKKKKRASNRPDTSKTPHQRHQLKDTSIDELNVPVDTLTWDIPEKIAPLKKNEYVERLESITSDGDCKVDSEFTENKLSLRKKKKKTSNGPVDRLVTDSFITSVPVNSSTPNEIARQKTLTLNNSDIKGTGKYPRKIKGNTPDNNITGSSSSSDSEDNSVEIQCRGLGRNIECRSNENLGMKQKGRRPNVNQNSDCHTHAIDANSLSSNENISTSKNTSKSHSSDSSSSVDTGRDDSSNPEEGQSRDLRKNTETPSNKKSCANPKSKRSKESQGNNHSNSSTSSDNVSASEDTSNTDSSDSSTSPISENNISSGETKSKRLKESQGNNHSNNAIVVSKLSRVIGSSSEGIRNADSSDSSTSSDNVSASDDSSHADSSDSSTSLDNVSASEDSSDADSSDSSTSSITQNNISSGETSDDLSDTTEGLSIESSCGAKKVNDSNRFEINGLKPTQELPILSSRIENLKQITPVDQAKKGHQERIRHVVSEEKRLTALREKNEKAKIERKLVKGSLQKVDHRNTKDKINHIVFGSSGEDNDVVSDSRRDTTISKKVTGTAAISWLGLDSAEDSEEENENTIKIKPQFEGTKGEKLLRLQHKIGPDDRFKLDERFLDSESDGERSNKSRKMVTDHDGLNEPVDELSANEDGDNGDTVSNELQKERERSLAILQEILGGNALFRADTFSCSDKSQDLNQRYDPSSEGHEQFEIQAEPESDVEETKVNKTKKFKTVTEENSSSKEQEVSKEKFYEVNAPLKDLFGESNTQTFKFGFSKNSNEENDEKMNGLSTDNNAVDTEKNTTRKRKIPAYFSEDKESDVIDRSEDHIGVDSKEADQVKKKTHASTFFFTADDPRLKSDAVDSPFKFMRTQSLKKITADWEATKKGLTQDYKKKHKDSLKRKRKMTGRTRFNVK